MTVQVLVRLAAIDPWSFTVLDTLRRKLGRTEVTRVERLKCWELEFRDGGAEHAQGIARKVMRETALLANPNRDVWAMRILPGEALPSGVWERSDRGVDAYVIRVSDKEDLVGRSMGRILTKRLGIADIKGVAFSTIWVIETTAGPGSGEVAGEIAVARAWRKGLLANPHCQDALVYPAEKYFGAEARRK
jgi:phosphoribosylformylglycinamidine (FGAM) synthase PurS component